MHVDDAAALLVDDALVDDVEHFAHVEGVEDGRQSDVGGRLDVVLGGGGVR